VFVLPSHRRDRRLLELNLGRVPSNFSITFNILSITTLYNTGLTFSGPATMTLGWFVAGAFTMAEICSTFPTSGGLYYWSARLSGHRWAPFASWMVIVTLASAPVLSYPFVLV
jgi:amino acid transporter